jgi:hypothetical protein
LTRLREEKERQREWVDGLAAKYGIIRIQASLTKAQAAAQQDRLLRALGLKFLPTEPLRVPDQLSLKCRLYGDNPHEPCSGTTDDGLRKTCLHWCHD